MTRRLNLWPLLILFSLLMLVIVSGASFWIDEAVTARAAGEPTFSTWWHYISTSGMTEVQMPLYSLFVWAYAKAFGVGEFTLRFAGALWLIPGLTAFVLSFPRGGRRMAALLAAVSNAFIWYYANEARTYAMQMGGSFMVLAALNRLAAEPVPVEEEKQWLLCLMIGLLVVCATSMLGMFWAIAALGAVWVLFPVRRLLDFWRAGWVWWVALVICLAALGCYYLLTLKMGARGSNVGTTDWRTTIFILYDQLGFEGLGPGRTELRSGGVRALLPYAPALGLYAVFVAIVVFMGITAAWQQSRRKTAAIAAFIALPWLFLSLVGMATHFRLLGRHCCPLLPVWLLLIARGLMVLARKPGWIGKAIAGAFIVLSLYSCLSVRFAYRQSKDDYRRAAEIAAAELARNGDVWWSANDEAATYYHLPLSDTKAELAKALSVVNPSAQVLDGTKQPQLILVSRPDLFDVGGALANYIASRHFKLETAFPGFQVWTAPAQH